MSNDNATQSDLLAFWNAKIGPHSLVTVLSGRTGDKIHLAVKDESGRIRAPHGRNKPGIRLPREVSGAAVTCSRCLSTLDAIREQMAERPAE